MLAPLVSLAALLLLAGGEPPRSEAPAASQRPRLVVLALQAAGGVEPGVAASLTEAVTTEVASRGLFDVVSTADVQTLVGLERQRQMLGCSTEEASSCLTELAGALGARFVLSGSLVRLGTAYQLNLQTLDTTRATPVGRATRMATDLATLRAQLGYTVAEATGTPLPPPPSRVLPYSLMGAGALALVGGGIVGFQALSQEGAIQRELENGRTQPSALKTMAAYREELVVVERQRTLSLLALGAGAALLTAGVLLNPPDPLEGVRTPSLALTLSGSGVGLAGTWP